MGRPHRTIARRPDADRRPCNFRAVRDVLAPTTHDPDRHVGCPCAVAGSRHSRSPGRAVARARIARAALGPAPRRARADRRAGRGRRRARRWRPGSCSTVTPASGRGWRSRSTCANDGPPVNGELRLAGGAQGQTRFGTAGRPADPVGQDLHPLRPAAGLRSAARGRPRRTANRTVATAKVAFTIHDATQLVVGVIAEHPDGIVGEHRPARQRRPARRR